LLHSTGLKFSKVAFDHSIGVTNVNIKYFDKTKSNKIDVCLSRTSPSIGVLIDSKCALFESIVTFASEYVLFDSVHKWLILHEIHDGVGDDYSYNDTKSLTKHIPYMTLFRSLNLSVNADIVVASHKDNDSCILYDVFNFGKNRDGRFVVKAIGSWNTVTGLNLTRTSKYYRRFDYHQMVLKLILVMSPPPKNFDPQMLLTWNPASNVPALTHTSSIFMHEIAEIHNIRYNYTVVDVWIGDYKREHAYTAANGIYFHEHDVTPVLRMLLSHFDKYDVAFPVTRVETRFFYKIPTQGVGKFENKFLKPFSKNAWLSVVGITLLCGLMLLLSMIVEERRPLSLVYPIFSVLALICQQFFEEFEDLRSISSVRKLTTLVTGVFCLLTYNYYTSSVVSWLLNAPPPSINSLWELLDSPLQPVFQDTGFSYSWLQVPNYYYNTKHAKAEDELKKKMKKLEKKGKPILIFPKDGISLVKEGGYVYHGEVDSANKIIAETFKQRELCDLGSLQSMDKTFAYISVQKRSPYKEFFTWSSLRLMETGILNRIHKRTLSGANKCEGSTPRALALGGAAPAFILLAAGYILAVILVVFERIIHHHQ
ncbi:ionotropic receptor 75a-like, partial [Danaus plexippus]|uniref:ionotropic receptor 75a-like n=1 Tax=Danaus plexippus TaxID=13037 RepID=UPI002AB12F60